MGADDGADVAPGGVEQALQVGLIVGPRVDDEVAGLGLADQVAVGARAGHGARVGGGQALHVPQQGDGGVVAPVQVVFELAIGAGQLQLAKRGFVFHEARLAPLPPAGARTTDPLRAAVRRASLEQGGAVGVPLQVLQRAHRGIDQREVARRVPLQRRLGCDPDGLELLVVIGQRCLARRHGGDEKRHVEANRQVAVRDPVREPPQLVQRQRQPAVVALG